MDVSSDELNRGTANSTEAADSEFWGQVLDKVSTGDPDKPNDGDAEALATSAVAEIDKLMGDLVSARDYLVAEAERIKRETARLRNLSKTAVASVHIISDNLSKWRENGKQAA
jgi:flagellin-like hook-associated protein FlgL